MFNYHFLYTPASIHKSHCNTLEDIAFSEPAPYGLKMKLVHIFSGYAFLRRLMMTRNGEIPEIIK